MALFKRKTRTPKGQLSDEESMARYVYLLNTLPPSVIEHAHETAFRELPEAKRREMYERLTPFMSEEEKAREAEPSLLARVMQRVSAGVPVGDPVTARVGRDARPTNMWPFSDPMLGPLVAMHFLMSSNITSYFTVGAGSVGLASEPAWVGDLGGRPGWARRERWRGRYGHGQYGWRLRRRRHRLRWWWRWLRWRRGLLALSRVGDPGYPGADEHSAGRPVRRPRVGPR